VPAAKVTLRMDFGGWFVCLPLGTRGKHP